MNKDQVKGVTEKVKGKVNETVGRATGDTAQEDEWRLQGSQDQAEAHEDALRLDHEEQENN